MARERMGEPGTNEAEQKANAAAYAKELQNMKDKADAAYAVLSGLPGDWSKSIHAAREASIEASSGLARMAEEARNARDSLVLGQTKTYIDEEVKTIKDSERDKLAGVKEGSWERVAIYQSEIEQMDSLGLKSTELYKELLRDRTSAFTAANNKDIQEEISKLQEQEKLKIAATFSGSRERVTAISAAIEEEQENELQDTSFYKSLLTQKLEASRAESKAETEARLKAIEDSSKHEIEDADSTLKKKLADSELEARTEQEHIAAIKAQRNQPEKGIAGGIASAMQIPAENQQENNIAAQQADRDKQAYLTAANAKIAALQQVEIANDLAYLNMEINDQAYANKDRAIQDEIVKAAKDSADKQIDIDKKMEEQKLKNAQQEAAEEKKAQDQIANSLANTTNMMLFQSKNFHDAVTKLWQSMVKNAIQQFIQMATQYIAHLLMMLVVHQTTKEAEVATDATAAAQGAEIGQVSRMREIAGNAAVAASGVYRALAPIPVIGPILAPAAAAATYAAVMAFGAFAEQGWDVPEGGPFPTVLHGREMVLPSPIADTVRDAVSGGGVGRTRGGMPGEESGDYNFALHYHAGNVSALDGAGVGEVLKRNRNELVKIVRNAVKGGHISRRELLRGGAIG